MRRHSAGTRDDLTAVIWQTKKTANTDKYGMYYRLTDGNICDKQANAVKPETILDYNIT
jgi:hypothetical protein